jgi:hypothetical protein
MMHRGCVAAVAVVVLLVAGTASAQDRDTVARALEQADCPLTLETLDLAHDDRGSTVKLRVLNEGRADVTRYVINVWILFPDGTVRGTMKSEQRQAIAAGANREISLTIRSRVVPTDTIVVAVLETQGDAWTGDAKAIEAEARALVKK